MNVLLFAGFLGAGKTSLILSLARHLVDTAPPGAPDLVIVENEIGEAGVDNQVLASGGYMVRELFAGCVCCQLSTDLTLMLNDLAETTRPPWVIVEATGLARPGNIVTTLRAYGRGIDALRTITIVDAERWAELVEVAPGLVEGQVSEADAVLVNKVDAVSHDIALHVRSAVELLNPGASVCELSAHTGVSPSVWQAVIGAVPPAGVR